MTGDDDGTDGDGQRTDDVDGTDDGTDGRTEDHNGWDGTQRVGRTENASANQTINRFVPQRVP